jgi:hypothetical protein
MERCPNCHARWDGAEHCRRCGLELAPLLAAEHAAHRLIGRALARLAAGEGTAALSDLSRARGLHDEPFIALLQGFAGSEAGDDGRMAIASARSMSNDLKAISMDKLA